MTSPDDLARADRAYVVAPAGCGKTELITAAIAAGGDGRQLVLTHTHAGVGALRNRFQRRGVQRSRVRVETIAGFALRVAAAYPATSGFSVAKPKGKEWSDVYEAAVRVLSTRIGQEVLRASYNGVYVDEYQDCVADQQSLVLVLAEALPVRVLGDPLQGIFDFAGQQLVDWDQMDSTFERLPDLRTPWRWKATNPELGEWLLSIRADLSGKRVPDLRSGPIEVRVNSDASQIKACWDLVGEQSVVAVRKWAKDAHSVASRLGGHFTSMEEMESRDLQTHAGALGARRGCDRALAVIAFASICMTQVRKHLATTEKRLLTGAMPRPTVGAANQDAVEALRLVSADDSPGAVTEALKAIRRLPETKVYRNELLSEMGNVLKLAASRPGTPWEDVAWEVRDRARRNGRRLERRVISRTLLIKGLEFDHAIVLNIDELDVKNLYVAMTRGSKSLTVLTAR